MIIIMILQSNSVLAKLAELVKINSPGSMEDAMIRTIIKKNTIHNLGMRLGLPIFYIGFRGRMFSLFSQVPFGGILYSCNELVF